jgi:hypothetical protein
MENLCTDIEELLSKRHDNGGDLWATQDKKICKGGPFSTLGSTLILSELTPINSLILKEIAELIFSTWREDGRLQIAPRGAIYPCHTAGVARILCRLGYVSDIRLKKTLNHMLDIQHIDGGWRCNTYKYGRGPETVYSNPGTTLEVLYIFKYTPYLNNDKRLDKAVDFY